MRLFTLTGTIDGATSRPDALADLLGGSKAAVRLEADAGAVLVAATEEALERAGDGCCWCWWRCTPGDGRWVLNE
jgi:hypothetical protein